MIKEDMDILDTLATTKKILIKDIKSIVSKGDITGDAEYKKLDAAMDILKEAVTVCAMIEHSDKVVDEMGGMYPEMTGMNSYAPGGNNSGYYPMMNSYADGGNSYERGRSARTGRYVSRDDGMMPDYNTMLNSAQNEQEREFVRRMMHSR